MSPYLITGPALISFSGGRTSALSRRFNFADDLHIVRWLQAAGPFCIAMDLDRPQRSIAVRAKHLKATGAWAAIEVMLKSVAVYYRALGAADEFDLFLRQNAVVNFMKAANEHAEHWREEMP